MSMIDDFYKIFFDMSNSLKIYLETTKNTDP